MTKQQEVAALRAERERLQAQTGAQIVARMVGEGGEKREQKQDEPFIPGLPDKRLREVWAEWEDEDDPSRQIVIFKGDTYRWSFWHAKAPDNEIGERQFSGISLRPHGKTRAEVEAMADAAERKPALLDLRGLKVGTVCEATADIQMCRITIHIAKGACFAVVEDHDAQRLPGEASVRVDARDGSWRIPALVPARVVEVPQ